MQAYGGTILKGTLGLFAGSLAYLGKRGTIPSYISPSTGKWVVTIIGMNLLAQENFVNEEAALTVQAFALLTFARRILASDWVASNIFQGIEAYTQGFGEGKRLLAAVVIATLITRYFDLHINTAKADAL